MEPDPEQLGQVLALLANATKGDTVVQEQVRTQMAEFEAVPDFNVCLSHICFRLTDQEMHLRSLALVLLKNNLCKHVDSMPAEIVEALRTDIMQGMADPEAGIRKMVGTTISQLVSRMATADGDESIEWLCQWPTLMPALLECLGSGELAPTDGAMNALLKISTDVPDRMARDSTNPLDHLLPKVFEFFGHEHDDFRRDAVAVVNSFIYEMPEVLMANMDTFLEGLFHLTADENPHVRQQVCRGIGMLTSGSYAGQSNLETLMPHIEGVIGFMLASTADDGEGVAIEAVDFWHTLVHTFSPAQAAGREALRAHLPELLPVLLNRMVYEDDDPALEFAEDDEDRLDDESEVGPMSAGAHPGEEDEDDDDEYGNETGGGDSYYTLRKGAGRSLDAMASVYPDEEVLAVFLPLVTSLLSAEEWERRESGIMAIGAIAEGCSSLETYLPDLLPMLLGTVDDEHFPLIRSISCWTLGRFKGWLAAEANREEAMGPVLEKLLTRCLDSNKNVQYCAISSFAELEETAGRAMVPYIGECLKFLVAAFEKYQAKNLIVLYDAVGTLAAAVGDAFAAPEHMGVIMPALIAKWESTPDENRALVPLLACMTKICANVGEAFGEYVEPVYARCTALIAARVQAVVEHGDVPVVDFAAVAFDLVETLVEKMGASMAPLIADGEPALMHILHSVLSEEHDRTMLRGALCLLGELSQDGCFELVQPHLAEFLPLVAKHIENHYVVYVCSNGMWALGEMALQLTTAGSAELEPYVEGLVEPLARVVNLGWENPRTNRALLNNSAVALGRVAVAAPAVAAAHADAFVAGWACSLRNVTHSVEKPTAFRGFVAVLQANPEAAIPHMKFVCEAFASWGEERQRERLASNPELHLAMKQTLEAFQLHMGGDWAALWASLHHTTQAALTEIFQL